MQSVAQSWMVYKITGSGAPNAVAVGGGACICGSIFFGWKMPRIRGEARKLIVALQMTGGEPASKASFQQPVMARSEK